MESGKLRQVIIEWQMKYEPYDFMILIWNAPKKGALYTCIYVYVYICTHVSMYIYAYTHTYFWHL